MAMTASAADFANHTPHYNIFGCQHHRVPYKDKSHLLTADIRHHRWLEPPPAIRSRSELQQARKRGRVPDPSYDFDGDGVVGQLDYFVGRSFDRDNDGRLDPSERRQAEQALQNGFLDSYVRGFDSQGDKMRAFAVQQRRGVILSGDNAADVSLLTYPKHHNAHKTPKHSTQTALHLARVGERKGKGAEIGERYIASNQPIHDLPPPNAETHPRTCEISNIRERAEADHQASRVRGGLLPMNTYMNPERESRTAAGLGWDGDPAMKTRSQLLETRKEGMRQECEVTALRNAEHQVPLSVRRTAHEAMQYEFRQPDPNAMTLTKLKDQRKRDKIEYDMERFAHKHREYPRFSDRPDIPFWAPTGEDVQGMSASQAPPVAMSRSISEPAFKINEIPFGDDYRETHDSLPVAAHRTAAGLPAQASKMKTTTMSKTAAMGSNTKKRFCAELIERGQARNQPRLFDAIQPVHTGAGDFEDLDIKSSMAPVREAAFKKRAEQRKRNADIPRKSMLWSDPMNTSSAASQAPTDAHGMASISDGMTSMTMERRSQVSAPVQSRGLVKHVSSDPALRGSTMVEAPREPRFFGSVTSLKPDTTQGIGVRCGGFQRLDWPSQHTMTQPPHEKKSRSVDRGNSRDRTKDGHAAQDSA